MSSITLANLEYIKPAELKALILEQPRGLPPNPFTEAAAANASESTAESTDKVKTEPKLKSQSEKDPPPSRSLAIIDVRDSDYVDGHLPFHMHVPSNTLSFAMPDLINTLKDTKTVVFHCALSQQRGPSAALRYLRERGRFGGAGEEQEVKVLEGGFVRWQQLFGKDEQLTVGWEGGEAWEYM